MPVRPEREMLDREVTRSEYADFVVKVEPRIRHALIGSYGPEIARDATADALVYGWEHWDRLAAMDNPAGYLYRVAQTWARRSSKSIPTFPPVVQEEMPWIEPGLPAALAHLSERQRAAVWTIHGLGWQAREVAELIGISVETVRTHARRGMEKLRRELGGEV